jgi:Subtilase family
LSPNQVFPSDSGPRDPIAERVLANPNLTYEVGCDDVVIAVKAELLVNRLEVEASPELRKALEAIATRCGTLADIPRMQTPSGRTRDRDGIAVGTHVPDPSGPAANVELWRLTDPTRDSIDESRRLRQAHEGRKLAAETGPTHRPPVISPNHVAILSPVRGGGCPATPPQPARHPDAPFVLPQRVGPSAKVTVLDSGYIYIDPPHEPHLTLDQRVTLVDGERLAIAPNGTASWVPDDPDALYLDAEGELDGITGHGTFIAGLIAHICPEAELTVVGLRNQEVELGRLDPTEQLGLFETELAITYALLTHADTDVIQCGFAFPTLDDYPSLPFAAAMQELRQPGAPRGGQVAVVAPAGNEQSRHRYWPAALDDVIGVAATNRRGDGRAWFSNWGDWCNCCTRGEHIYSTFVYYDGPIEGEPLNDIEHFHGWARWNGTSFAAPQVSAAIAGVVANSGLLPMEAWATIVGDAIATNPPLVDYTLNPSGVPLPYLHID